MTTYTLLIAAPLFFALVVMVSGVVIRNIFAIAFVIGLSFLSISNIFVFHAPTETILPHFFHNLFILLDGMVLLFFLWQGVKTKNSLVKKRKKGEDKETKIKRDKKDNKDWR